MAEMEYVTIPANVKQAEVNPLISAINNITNVAKNTTDTIVHNALKQANLITHNNNYAVNSLLDGFINQNYAATVGTGYATDRIVAQSTQNVANAIQAGNAILNTIFNNLSQTTQLQIKSVLDTTSRIAGTIKENALEQNEIIRMLANGQISLIHNTLTQDAKPVSPEEAVKLYQETINSDKIKAGVYSGDITNCDDISLPSSFEGLIPLFTLACRLKKFTDYLASREQDIKVVINNLNDSKYNNLQEFWDAFYGKGVSGDTIAFFNTIATSIPFLIRILNTSYAESNAELDRLELKTVQPNRLDANTLIESLRRGKINLDTFYSGMLDIGWSKDRAFKLLELSTFYPTVNELQEMYRRGYIQQGDIKNLFNDIGIDDKFLDDYEKLSWLIPPIQDVIRMAVRDVFNPDVVEQGGLFKDIPSEYIKRAKLSGLREEDAKLYWGAHWVIPSIQQGYELFQRDVINRQQLETLFKSADIAPNWRDPLLQISYNVPTRVDVRRMYEDNVIDDNQVRRYLADYGYSPDNVDKVFLWYKKRKDEVNKAKIPDIKNLTESVIKKAYLKGLLSRQEAIQKLVSLSYSYGDADLILDLIDIDKQPSQDNHNAKDIANRLFKLAEDAFKNYAIDSSKAKSILSSSGLLKGEIDAYISIWELELSLDRDKSIINQLSKLYIGFEIERLALQNELVNNGFNLDEANNIIEGLEPFRNMRSKDLSRTDIRKAYFSKDISKEEYEEQLKGLGYSDRDMKIIESIEGIK